MVPKGQSPRHGHLRMASRRRRRTPSELLVDDDTITAVLLRLPPDEPAYLVRASLVCRQWHRILSDHGFHRLYAGFHRTPPLLGFFNSSEFSHTGRTPCFVPTTAAASPFSSSSVAAAGSLGHCPWLSSSAVPAAGSLDHCPWLVLDCRHGRVLLQRRQPPADDDALGSSCLVWDAITGDRHELRWPNNVPRRSAVVLCAAGRGCDHSGCRGGRPFLVLCAGVVVHSTAWRAYAYVYSSQLRSWGAPVYLDLHDNQHYFAQSRAVVIGDQVYFFRFLLGEEILKYDLAKQCLSVIVSPDLSGMDTDVELMISEEGLLGLASCRGSTLNLWSRTTMEAEAEEVVRWEKSRVIDLRMMVSSPADNGNNIIKQANVIGFADGVNAIFVGTNAGTFVIDLKSGRARKVCEAWILDPVVPFMMFYSPDWTCGKLPLPAEMD